MAPVNIVQMRLLGEQIAGDELHHRAPAVVVTQINDDSVAVGHEVHRRCRGRRADLGVVKLVELQITDIGSKMLGLFETAITGNDPLASRWVGVGMLIRLLGEKKLLTETDSQVLIVSKDPQVITEPPGENLPIGDGAVCAALFSLPE